MAIVRQNGQLVESNPNDQNTQKLAQLQGAAITPTSPAGVAQLGGTPGQAKMAGTPAQQAGAAQNDLGQPVLEQQQQPAQQQQDLTTAERTASAREDQSQAEQTAATKAQQLQSLGSLGTRVQSMIAQQLAPQQQATAQVDQTKIQALTTDPAQQAAATSALQRIYANPNDKQAVADAANLWSQNGWGDISNFLPQTYQADAAQTLGANAQQNLEQQGITLGKMQLSPQEQSELAQVFGDQWQNFTPEQLNQQIEDMRQQEYSQVQGVQAQLQSAQGAQKTALTKELQDLGQAGVTGVEQGVQSLQQAVQKGDTVRIGGEDHKVEDLLKDGEISNLIGRMLNDDSLMKQVGQSNPDFAKWVQNNQQVLSTLAGQVAQTTSSVKDINSQKQQLGQQLGLSNDVLSQLVPDWNKTTTSVPDVSKVGVLSMLQNADPSTKTKMASSLSQLAQADPTTFKALSSMPADKVQNAWDYGQAIKADTSGLLAKLTGLDPGSAGFGFVADAGMQQQIASYQPTVDALNKVIDTPGMQAALNDPNGTIPSLIKSGQFHPEDAELLAKSDDPIKVVQNWTDHQKLMDKVNTAIANKDSQALVDTLFGGHMDIDQINSEYALAQQVAKIEPDNAAAQAQLKALGQVVGKDPQTLAQLIEQGTGNATDFDSFLKGGAQAQSGTDLENQLKQAGSTPLDASKLADGGFFNKMQDILKSDNGKITGTDLMKLVEDKISNDPTYDMKAAQNDPDLQKFFGNKQLTGQITDRLAYNQGSFLNNYVSYALQHRSYAQADQFATQTIDSLPNFSDVLASIQKGGSYAKGSKEETTLGAIQNALQVRAKQLQDSGDTSGAQAINRRLEQVNAAVNGNKANLDKADKKSQDTAKADKFQGDLKQAYNDYIDSPNGKTVAQTGQTMQQWLKSPEGQAATKKLMQQYGYTS